MKIKSSLLRSKVAQRIFLLFIACALIPITAQAILGFIRVTQTLHDQGEERLHQMSKVMSDSIIERSKLMLTEMRILASSLISSSREKAYELSEESITDLQIRFQAMGIISEKGDYIPLLGSKQEKPKLDSDIREQILSGKTHIWTEYYPADQSRIFMCVPLVSELKNKEILIAEVSPNFLWFGTYGPETLSYRNEIFILDRSNKVLFSTLLTPLSFSENILNQLSHPHSNLFKWTYMRKKYLAGYRSVPFLTQELGENLKLVVIEPMDFVLEPVDQFKYIFLFIILSSFWLVLGLSVSQIRRSLIPLEKLKEGTERISNRDFDSRVQLVSHDEFEEVAKSFNTMASQLGRQFKTLTTMAEIDRTILSALDVDKIVNTVLTRMREVFPCKSVSMTLIDPQSGETAQTYTGEVIADKVKQMEKVIITPDDMTSLMNNPESLLIAVDDNLPQYLDPLARRGVKSFLILPIFLKQKLTGIITLGYIKSPKLDQNEMNHARQLADQVAVAFSNARLIEELNELNWGTLTALARTIDAKSSWTAGHSERSTKLALKIGKVMDLPQEELADLHRAGLLHDIGKLGIPGDIINKTGNLTKEEEELMRKHTILGARILEPIAAYSEVIPIVLQHHEHYDGTGYPDGLVGEDINLGARIFCVADTYDAVTSDRPYRKAFTIKRAIEFIKKGAGIQFDPNIVEAFLKTMKKEARK